MGSMYAAGSPVAFRSLLALSTVLALTIAPPSASSAEFGDRGVLSKVGTFVATGGRLFFVRPSVDADAYVLQEYDERGAPVTERRIDLPATASQAGSPASAFQYGDFAFAAEPGSLFVRWGGSITSIPVDAGSIAAPSTTPDCPGCARAFVTPDGTGSVLVTRGIGYPGSGAELSRWSLTAPSERTSFAPPSGGRFPNLRTAFTPVDGGVVASISGQDGVVRFDRKGAPVWRATTNSLLVSGKPVNWGLVTSMPDGSLRIAGTTTVDQEGSSTSALVVGALTSEGTPILDFGMEGGLTVVRGMSIQDGAIKSLRDGSFVVGSLLADAAFGPRQRPEYQIVKFDARGQIDTSFGGPKLSRGSLPGTARVPFALWSHRLSVVGARSFQIAESRTGDLLIARRVQDPCTQTTNASITYQEQLTRVVRLPITRAAGMHPDRVGNLHTLPRTQHRFIGTARCDLVQSFGGNIDIRTGAGRDVVNVQGNGIMRIAMGSGNDLVDGPATGRATILGGTGDDTLRAGWSGPSRIVAGQGRDIVVGSYRRDIIDVVDGRAGDLVTCYDSKLRGTRSDDLVRVDPGDRTIDCRNVLRVR